MKKLKENGHQREEDLKMHARKITQFRTRNSIQLRRDMERSRLEMVVGNHCSVGYVVRIIIRGIIRSIRVVVDPKYIVLRRHT